MWLCGPIDVCGLEAVRGVHSHVSAGAVSRLGGFCGVETVNAVESMRLHLEVDTSQRRWWLRDC